MMSRFALMQRLSTFGRLSTAIKHTMLYGSSIALMKGVSLLMLPFILHHIPEAEFGRLEIISSLAVIGSILVGLGLEDALYRFAGGCQDPEKRKRLAAQIFTLTLFVGIIALTFGFFIALWLAPVIPGELDIYQIQLVLGLLALEGCIAVPLGWLRMCDRAIPFFALTTGRAIGHAILTVLAVLAGRGITGILEAGLIAAIAQAVVLVIIQYRDTGFGLSRSVTRLSLAYCTPIMASGLMVFALNGLDRWILASYATLEDVAKFGVAAKFALAVVLLLQPFGMWWMPKRFDVLYGLDGREHAARLTGIGLSLLLIIATSVGLVTPLVITAVMPESYLIAAQYATLLVIAALFREMAELLNLGSLAGKSTLAQMVINAVSAFLAVVLMMWWGNESGVWGVLSALVTVQGFRLCLFYITSQYLYRLPYKTGSLFVLTVAALCWLAIGQLSWSLPARVILLMIAPAMLAALAIRLKMLPGLNLLARRKVAA